jgi:hypothetical protein
MFCSMRALTLFTCAIRPQHRMVTRLLSREPKPLLVRHWGGQRLFSDLSTAQESKAFTTRPYFNLRDMESRPVIDAISPDQLANEDHWPKTYRSVPVLLIFI